MSQEQPFVFQPPAVHGSPYPWPRVKLPKKVLMRPVTWRPNYSPTPIFIKSFSCDNVTVDVFGVTFDLTQSTSQDEFNVINFVLVVGDREHRDALQLAQDMSPLFTSEPVKHVPSEKIKKDVSSWCVSGRPKWKWEAALWPVVDGRPFQFLGQVTVPPVPSVAEFFTDVTLFLFCALPSNEHQEPIFAIFTQQLDAQTDEEHYREENQ